MRTGLPPLYDCAGEAGGPPGRGLPRGAGPAARTVRHGAGAQTALGRSPGRGRHARLGRKPGRGGACQRAGDDGTRRLFFKCDKFRGNRVVCCVWPGGYGAELRIGAVRGCGAGRGAAPRVGALWAAAADVDPELPCGQFCEGLPALHGSPGADRPQGRPFPGAVLWRMQRSAQLRAALDGGPPGGSQTDGFRRAAVYHGDAGRAAAHPGSLSPRGRHAARTGDVYARPLL